MRSSDADSRGEVFTEEICLGVVMTKVMHTKEPLVWTQFAQSTCVKLNLAVSCHATSQQEQPKYN